MFTRYYCFRNINISIDTIHQDKNVEKKFVRVKVVYVLQLEILSKISKHDAAQEKNV